MPSGFGIARRTCAFSVAIRCRTSWPDLRRLAHGARHPGQTVVMVGHDSVNRALLLQLLDHRCRPLATRQDPCTLNEVESDGDKVQILRINDTSHLP